MSGEKIEYNYANAAFELSPSSFWTLFTEPSLKVLLHYSVNSYTDDAVLIKSPLAVAALAFDQEKTTVPAVQTAPVEAQSVEPVSPQVEEVLTEEEKARK